MHQVKIFTPKGKLKRIITPKQLQARSDAIFKAAFKKTKVYSGGSSEAFCDECKESFEAKTERAMYCSPKCRNQAYKKRKGE